MQYQQRLDNAALAQNDDDDEIVDDLFSGEDPRALPRSDEITWTSILFEHTLFQFLRQIAFPGNIFVILCSLASTLYFYYYLDDDGVPLAGKLNFAIIGTAVLFPALFMANNTGSRRVIVMFMFSQYKAHLCQVLTSLLNWRSHVREEMDPQWDEECYNTCVQYALALNEILVLPTLIIRHGNTMHGRRFRARVLRMRAKRVAQLIKLGLKINVFVEDIKGIGMSAQESIHIYNFTFKMSRNVEELMMHKAYRSSEVARAYIRIILFICVLFYGPYYSFVAGNLWHGTGGQTNVVFACFLTILTTVTLLGVVSIQRTLEDPFKRGRSAFKMSKETEQLTEQLHNIYMDSKLQRNRRINKIT